MTKKDKPKEYKIDSLEKLCNLVNSENQIRLSIDLAQWLVVYASTIEAFRKKHPKECKGKLNTEIAVGSFIWIDDGETDMKGISIENSKTGEIRHKKFKK